MPPTPCRRKGSGAIAAEAQGRDALLQIHLSETAAECALVAERYGMSAPALLAGRGARRRVPGARTRSGSTMPTSGCWRRTTWRWPTARARTASSGPGVAPLRRLLERGVHVGLGTDGPASNDDLHLWDEMRLAALLGPGHRRRSRGAARRPRRSASPPAGGGEALGLPVGALEVGRPADVIRLRTDDPRFTPAVNDAELLGHLVWAGAGYLVTDVWVGGAAVVEDGRCTTVDGERARARSGGRARRLLGS